MKDKIIVICGFSGAGKDTVARYIENEYGAHFVISTTTRPMRDGESEKNPYYFVSSEEFRKSIEDGEFIEYRTYNTLVDGIPDTWYYGAKWNEVAAGRTSVTVLDMIGLRDFKRVFGDRCVTIFISTPDDVRERFCKERGDYNESEFNRRLADDRLCFPPEVVQKEVDYIIQNRGKGLGELVLEVDCVMEKAGIDVL